MRLTCIEMVNVNSLRGLNRIDFEAPPLAGENIFLITGPTGSGKTSILDAVCAALFDRTPRLSSKMTRMLRCQAEKSASIALSFESSGVGYLHRWQVDGRDVKKVAVYRDGVLLPGVRISNLEAHTESVLGLDFDAFTKTLILAQNRFDEFLKARPEDRRRIIETMTGNELLEKIKTMIRGEYEKFKSSYLASAERLAMAGRMRDEAAALGGDLEGTKARLEEAIRALGSLTAEKNRVSALAAAAAEFEAAGAKLEELLSGFDFKGRAGEIAMLERARDIFRDPLSRFDELGAALEAKKTEAKTWAGASAEADARLAGKEAELKALKSEAEAERGSHEKIRSALKLAGEIKAGSSAVSGEIRDLEEQAAAERKRMAEACRRESIALQKASEAAAKKAEADAIASSLDELAAEGLDLGKAAAAIERAGNLEAALERCAAERKRLLDAAGTYGAEKEKAENDGRANAKELEALSSSLEALSNELAAAENRLETMSEAEMACALRGRLEAGKKCPVCGSTDHPCAGEQTEKLDDMAFAEARRAVETLKREIAVTEKRITCARENGARITAAIANSVRELDARRGDAERVTREESSIAAELKNISVELLFPQPLATLPPREAIAAWQTSLERAAQAKKELAEAQIAIARAEGELATAAAEKQASSAALEKLLVRMETLAGRREELEKELRAAEKACAGFKAIEQLEEEAASLAARERSEEARLLDLTGKAAEARAMRNRLEAEAAAARISLSSKTAELNELYVIHSLEEKDARNSIERLRELDALKRTLAERTSEKNFIEARMKAIAGDAALGREAAAGLEGLAAAEREAGEKVGELNRLYGVESAREQNLKMLEEQLSKIETENKELTSEYRTLEALYGLMNGNEFRDFALSFHFKSILAIANRYLVRLTGGRYEFTTDDDHANQIFIKDFLNGGQARETATISGGESFMASLSLALALSQFAAGGAGAEFMFLDEGFGMLDPEALNEVLDMLSNLDRLGRRIGIISHIGEVAERIPARVTVKRLPDGYSAISV